MNRDQRIFIVDDEPEINDLIYRKILENEGYHDITTLTSISELLQALNQSAQEEKPVDLILMDVIMPEQDGIEGIQEVKRFDIFSDIPILMLTALNDKQLLKQAFDAGAIDYITKPVDPIEFVARVGAALRLKSEIDRRKAWEQELLEMTRGLLASNAKLEKASFMDPITGLLNRKAFDKRLEEDWVHSYVQKSKISMMLVQVDDFKSFNEQKGAMQGDACLQEIAAILNSHIEERMMLSRFGGAMFGLLFPGYEENQVQELAATIKASIGDLQVDHPTTESGYVTVSIGVASVDPSEAPSPSILFQQADLDLATSQID